MFQGRFFRRIVNLKAQIARTPELPFSEVLAAEQIDATLGELNVVYRDRLYSPSVTLWIFLSQVLSEDHSCRDAVARFVAFRAARGEPACSSQTGSYCEARQRLPEELLSRLARQTGQDQHRQVPTAWRLHGRPVKLLDGSTVSMPDTAENTAAFDKPRNQRGAARFPLARIVALLCLATGAALELAIGPYRGKQTGELSLFRQLQETLDSGDILLGDKLFCTYLDIARLLARGVDVVVRLHAHRKVDFRRGRRVGPNDHLVVWHKPAYCPDWLSAEEFAALPAELTMREVRVRVAIPGFRVRSLVVVTTLNDSQQFSAEDIANLYRQRWQAELDLRSIKSVMQMDILRCKTPDMVRKEIWAHLLAYNLLRSVMCAAAEEHGIPVRQVSFKGALQLLNAFHHCIITNGPQQLEAICTRLLAAVREHRVGNRPNRFEPRKRKRPAKPYPFMKASRHDERKRCLSNRLS